MTPIYQGNIFCFSQWWIWKTSNPTHYIERDLNLLYLNRVPTTQWTSASPADIKHTLYGESTFFQ